MKGKILGSANIQKAVHTVFGDNVFLVVLFQAVPYILLMIVPSSWTVDCVAAEGSSSQRPRSFRGRVLKLPCGVI